MERYLSVPRMYGPQGYIICVRADRPAKCITHLWTQVNGPLRIEEGQQREDETEIDLIVKPPGDEMEKDSNE